MHIKSAVLISCLVLMSLDATAWAQDAQTEADFRCMAVMAKINQLPDQTRRLESFLGGYYFLGRLQALVPTADLGSRTAAAYNKMSAADFLSETARCEQEVRANGHAMVEIGNAMPKAQPNTAEPGSQKPSDQK